MTKDEVFSNVILSLVVALDDATSIPGMELPTVSSKEIALVGMATAAKTDKDSVIMADELPDYITEAVMRRAKAVGLIVNLDDDDLLAHKDAGCINMALIRKMLDECDEPEEAFAKVRKMMIEGWPLLEQIRKGESGKGPKVEYELIRLNKGAPEDQN